MLRTDNFFRRANQYLIIVSQRFDQAARVRRGRIRKMHGTHARKHHGVLVQVHTQRHALQQAHQRQTESVGQTNERCVYVHQFRPFGGRSRAIEVRLDVNVIRTVNFETPVRLSMFHHS